MLLGWSDKQHNNPSLSTPMRTPTELGLFPHLLPTQGVQLLTVLFTAASAAAAGNVVAIGFSGLLCMGISLIKPQLLIVPFVLLLLLLQATWLPLVSVACCALSSP
jgi:hypothetical protein